MSAERGGFFLRVREKVLIETALLPTLRFMQTLTQVGLGIFLGAALGLLSAPGLATAAISSVSSTQFSLPNCTKCEIDSSRNGTWKCATGGSCVCQKKGFGKCQNNCSLKCQKKGHTVLFF